MSNSELKRIEKTAEMKSLLETILLNGIESIGLEPEGNASLTLQLNSESGYQSISTYEDVNALKWSLIQSILGSNIGDKEKTPMEEAQEYWHEVNEKDLKTNHVLEESSRK